METLNKSIWTFIGWLSYQHKAKWQVSHKEFVSFTKLYLRSSKGERNEDKCENMMQLVMENAADLDNYSQLI